MSNILLNKKNVRKINSYFTTVSGCRNIPYGLGSGLIAWFSRTRFAREEYFKGKKQMFMEFLESLPGDHDEKEAFIRLININHLKGWRSSAMSWMKPGKYRKFTQINGLEHLEKAVEAGKGVIVLNSHFGLAAAALTLFPMLGYKDYYTIVREKGLDSLKFEGLNEKVKPKLLAFKNNSQSELFRQMYRAREILNNGGIVHLLGDGYHGMSSNTIPFLGKLRGFRPSYVELSMATGAEVLPVFIDCDLRGRITADILPPLDRGMDPMSAEEKRDHMTRQYAAILEERWISQPWNVNWRFIEKHLYQVDANEAEP
jgi:lauroyl/myristoyl acyltransferase